MPYGASCTKKKPYQSHKTATGRASFFCYLEKSIGFSTLKNEVIPFVDT